MRKTTTAVLVTAVWLAVSAAGCTSQEMNNEGMGTGNPAESVGRNPGGATGMGSNARTGPYAPSAPGSTGMSTAPR